MIPLVLDPIVVAAVERACQRFLELQRPKDSALPPRRERETPAAVTAEIPRPPSESVYELR